jgi:hypothetical protein
MLGQGFDEPSGDLDRLGFLLHKEEQVMQLQGLEGSSWGNRGAA